MFTGIITDKGELLARKGSYYQIATSYDTASIALGASIACDGVCLTVIEKAPQRLAFQVSPETLSRSTLGEWQTGRPVNLERSIVAGGEFGGHFVTGHVDAVGEVTHFEAQPDGFWLLEIQFPPELAPYIAEKGSIAVNGVSLTVNQTQNQHLQITLIPHTAQHTNLGGLSATQRVNLEVDMLARYAIHSILPLLKGQTL